MELAFALWFILERVTDNRFLKARQVVKGAIGYWFAANYSGILGKDWKRRRWWTRDASPTK